MSDNLRQMIRGLYEKENPEKAKRLNDDIIDNIIEKYDGDYKSIVKNLYLHENPEKAKRLNDDVLLNIGNFYKLNNNDEEQADSIIKQDPSSSVTDKSLEDSRWIQPYVDKPDTTRYVNPQIDLPPTKNVTRPYQEQQTGISNELGSNTYSLSENISRQKQQLGDEIHKIGEIGDKNAIESLKNIFRSKDKDVPLQDYEGDNQITPTSVKTKPMWDEYKKLEQAEDLLSKAEEYKNAPNKNSLKSFLKGLNAPLAKDLLSAGLTEVERNLQIAKSFTGDTNADQKLIEAYKALKEIQENPESETGWTYQTGEVVSNMIPYMIQFALTKGAGTLVKGSANELLKTAASKGARAIAKKGAAYTVGAMGQAATMPMMYGKFGEEIAGGKDYGDAFLSAFMKTTGETFGESFGDVGSKLLTKALAKNAGPIRSNLMKAVGWNGPWEYLEENVTNAWNTLFTDERELKDFWNWKEQGIIALSTAIIGGPFALQNKVAKANIKNSLRRAEDKIDGINDEKLRNQIIGAVDVESPENTMDNIGNLIRSNNITDKKLLSDIGDYARSRIKYNAMFKGIDQAQAPGLPSDQSTPTVGPSFLDEAKERSDRYIAAYESLINEADKDDPNNFIDIYKGRIEQIKTDPVSYFELFLDDLKEQQAKQPDDNELNKEISDLTTLVQSMRDYDKTKIIPQDAPPQLDATPPDPRIQYETNISAWFDNEAHKESGNLITVNHIGLGPVKVVSGNIDLKTGKILEPDGTIMISTPEGNIPMTETEMADTPIIVPKDKFLNERMSAYDAEESRKQLAMQQSVEINGQRWVETGEIDPNTKSPVIELLDDDMRPSGQKTVIPAEELELKKTKEVGTTTTPETNKPVDVVKEAVWGKNTYKYKMNEDGTADVILNPKVAPQIALAEIQKHFETNPDYKPVPIEKETEIPPKDDFSRPTVQKIVTGIRIQPRTTDEGNIIKENKGEKVGPTKYAVGREEATRDEIKEMIELADSYEQLKDIKIENDPELTSYLNTKFKPAYTIDGNPATPDQVKARIRLGKDIDKITVKNDAVLGNFLKEAKKKLPKTFSQKPVNTGLPENKPVENFPKNEIPDEFNPEVIEKKRAENKDYDNKIINSILEGIKQYNNLPAKVKSGLQGGNLQNYLMNKASAHGMKITRTGYGREFGGFIQLLDGNGNAIKTAKILQEDKNKIQEHKSINDYSPEFKDFVNKFSNLHDNVKKLIELDSPMSIVSVNKAIKDMFSGKSTKETNTLLDNLDKIYNAGEVNYKPIMGERTKPMPINELFEFYKEEDLSDEEQRQAETLPDDVVESILLGQALTDEQYNQLNNLNQEWADGYSELPEEQQEIKPWEMTSEEFEEENYNGTDVTGWNNSKEKEESDRLILESQRLSQFTDKDSKEQAKELEIKAQIIADNFYDKNNHKAQVLRAKKEGKIIPDYVQAEYPEIFKQNEQARITEIDQQGKEVTGSENPKGEIQTDQTDETKIDLEESIRKYEEDDYTVDDLIDDLENSTIDFSAEIDKYYAEIEEDRTVWGFRGDADQYTDEFISAVRTKINENKQPTTNGSVPVDDNVPVSVNTPTTPTIQNENDQPSGTPGVVPELAVIERKNRQFDIINNSNPMQDEIHTGIRSVDDIKTAEDVFNESIQNNEDPTEDFTVNDIKTALGNRTLTVYSSKPIENGTFVTPSKMQAKSYAGNGKIYSKDVSVDDVAWIDQFEGQYANVTTKQETKKPDKPQDKFEKEFDDNLVAKRKKLASVNKDIADKKKSFKDRAAQSQKDLFPKPGIQQGEIETPIDLTKENIDRIMNPLIAEKEQLEKEIDDLSANRENIIGKNRKRQEEADKAQGELFKQQTKTGNQEDVLLAKKYDFGAGNIDMTVTYASSPESYEKIYGRAGGMLSFKLSGEGVNSNTKYKSVAGVVYEGKMTPDRLDKMAEQVARENAKGPSTPLEKNIDKAKKPTEEVEDPIYVEAKKVFNRMLDGSKPEDIENAKNGVGFSAAKFAMRYTTPEKNQKLYDKIYTLFFNGIKEYKKPSEPVKAPWEMTRDEYIQSKITGLQGYMLNDAVNNAGEEHKRKIKLAISYGKLVPENVLKDYPELKKEEVQKPGKQRINEEFGKPSYELLNNYLKSNKEEDIDYDRLIQTARAIIEKDNLKKDMFVAAISEALLYETGHAENWDDLRNSIKKGGYKTNKEATERKIAVGVKLPADIIEIVNESEKTETPGLIKEGSKYDVKYKIPDNLRNVQHKGISLEELVLLAITKSYKSFARPEYLKRYGINDNDKDRMKDTLYRKGMLLANGGITDKGREFINELQNEVGYLYDSDYQKVIDKYYQPNNTESKPEQKPAVTPLEQKVEKPTIREIADASKGQIIIARPAPLEPKPADTYGADNKLVTKDRYEELKKKMKDKLNNLNVGFDPELLAMGTEMAAYHVEAGARKFNDFARRMIGDLGDAIRPYLKAIYNGASDMPGMEELSKDMDDSVTVRAIDVNSITEEEEQIQEVEAEEIPDDGLDWFVEEVEGEGISETVPEDERTSLFLDVTGARGFGDITKGILDASLPVYFIERKDGDTRKRFWRQRKSGRVSEFYHLTKEQVNRNIGIVYKGVKSEYLDLTKQKYLHPGAKFHAHLKGFKDLLEKINTPKSNALLNDINPILNVVKPILDKFLDFQEQLEELTRENKRIALEQFQELEVIDNSIIDEFKKYALIKSSIGDIYGPPLKDERLFNKIVTDPEVPVPDPTKHINGSKMAFDKLFTIIDHVNLKMYENKRSGEYGDAFMPLNIEKQELEDNYNIFRDPKAYRLITEQNYKQNGDLMTDPRIDWAVFPSLGTAIPVNYEQNGLNIYREYVIGGEIVDLKGVHETLKFANNLWFPNLVDQGRTFVQAQTAPKPKPDLSERGSLIKTPQDKFIDSITDRLDKGVKIKNTPALVALATDAGMEQGKDYKDIKELYDTAGLVLNKYIADRGNRFSPENKTSGQAERIIRELDELSDLLPTETQRSATQVDLQQFSTPSSFAFLVNWIAGVNSLDTVLEPSAGEGNIAVFAKAAGAKVIVNEWDENRGNLLKKLGFYKVTKEDAKWLHASPSLKDDKVTVVVMNPPFSKDIALGGRMDLHAAEKHIDAALQKLEPGGRLVAIVGRGMSIDSPTHKEWWRKIGEQYNIVANIAVSGDAYTKKGTNFDNRLLVIDKAGKTTKVVKGEAQNYTELVNILQQIPSKQRNINKNEQANPNSGRKAETPGSTNTQPTLFDNPPANAGGVQRGEQRPSGNAPGRRGGPDAGNLRPTTAPRPESGGMADTRGGRGGNRGGNGGRNNAPGTGNNAGGASGSSNPGTPLEQEIGNRGMAGTVLQPLKLVKYEKKETASTAGYSEYTPEITIEGSKDHPTKLVESSAMSSVPLPDTDYIPSLPEKTVTSGALSNAQLEDVILAGNAHQQTLPSGSKRGFFLGAGTGYGKGRTIAAIILDNLNKGKKKSVWISMNDNSHRESANYWEAVGGNKKFVFSQKKARNKIAQKEGLLLMTYGTMAHGFTPKAAADLNEAYWNVEHTDRVQQIVQWLGKDFDGVIVFDESHKMANGLGQSGTRGKTKPTATALAGIQLQNLLPNAKIVYSSATGATEVRNLIYAQRLGLWGDGTPFGSAIEFISAVESSGVSGMEIIAKDMKAMGVYTAKTLSYDGVEYEQLEHKISPEQKDLYNQVAKAWQIIFRNFNNAIEINNTSSQAKMNAMSALFGTMQRFFSQIIVTLQMPSVIESMQRRLDENKSVVVQLVNTYEAQQERAILDSMDEDGNLDLEDIDMSPKSAMLDLLRTNFPVGLFQEVEDEDGKMIKVPVMGPDGHQLQNPEAVRMRDSLIAKLDEELTLPESPLDMMLNAFGAESVAEITGRKRRIVTKMDENGELAKVEEARSDAHLTKEIGEFYDGKKRILIFSNKGGTGANYHSDLGIKNQQQRVHFVLQAGWRADTAVQGFGRSHRANQANSPILVLPTTNLKSQRRFLSSIARRLGQLGALTKGQRETGGQGLLDESFNLEGKYARQALQQFYLDVLGGTIPGVNRDTLEEQMGVKLFKEKDGHEVLDETKTSDTKLFLNRIMMLEVDLMDNVFDAFASRLNDQIQAAIDNGTFDAGIENVKAENIKVVDEKEIYKDEKTGAKTYLTTLELEISNEKRTFDEIIEATERYGSNFRGFVRETKSGRLYAIARLNSMDARGNASYKIKRMSVVADSYFEMPEWDSNKYEKVSATEARDMWQIEHDNYPTTRKQNHVIVKGLILPIWNRLPEKISVRRYIDEKGKAHLGRFFFGRDIQNIMENFGVNANNFTNQQLKDILKSGGRVKLSNGFIFNKATYMGLNVAQIQRAVGYKDRERLQRAGAIYQVTSSLSGSGNFYITFDNFNEALDEIIRLYNAPVVQVEDENGDPVNNVGSIQMMFDQEEADNNIKNAATPEERQRAILEVANNLDSQYGNISKTKVVRTYKEALQALKKLGVVEEILKDLKSIMDYADQNNKRFPGFHIGGTVYFISDKIRDLAKVKEVWMHENVHSLVMNEFELDVLEGIYNSLPKDYIDQNVPMFDKDKSKANQADELIAYAISNLAKTNTLDDIINRNGNINDNIEELPLPLRHAVKTILNRFKEYGPQGNTNIKGRAADPDSPGSGRPGSRGIFENQKGASGTGRHKGDGNGSQTPLEVRLLSGGFIHAEGKQRPTDHYILVDGEYRTTRNSQGKLIHPTINGVKNFWRWFGNSKITDKHGQPLVMYHGTPNGNFDAFDIKKRGTVTDVDSYGDLGKGFYFTPKIDTAEMFSKAENDGEIKPHIFSVYLKIENPADLTYYYKYNRLISSKAKERGNSALITDDDMSAIYKTLGISEEEMDRILSVEGTLSDNWFDAEIKRDFGYDGIIGVDGDEYVVFDSNQIKSADENSGDFDPDNNGIRFMIQEAKSFLENDRTEYAELPEKDIPENTQTAYKLMKYFKSSPGMLFPLYARNDDGKKVGYKKGKWYKAEVQRVQIGGKDLAPRPGIHSVDLPLFLQGKAKAVGETRVWVKVTMPAMTPETQAENDATPTSKNGQREGIRERLIGPKEAYNYKTNNNATGATAWPIAGSVKIEKVLSDAEVAQILRDNGKEEYIEDSMTGDPNIRFMMSSTGTPLEEAADKWKEKAKMKREWKEVRDGMTEMWKDTDLPLKRLEEFVTESGGTLDDNSQPYRQITLAKGRMESLFKRYQRENIAPIKKAVANIINTGIGGENILPYAIAKHTLERNPDLRQKEIDKWMDKNKDAEQADIDAFIESVQDKDYSGIMPFDQDDKGNSIHGYTNPEELAGDIVAEFEGKVDPPLITDLWEAIRKAGHKTLDIWAVGNSMSEEELNYQKARYQYFVPLRGWREGAAKQLAYRRGEGFSRSLIHAEGRTSLAENPFAYIEQVAFKALGEQVDNEVKQEVLNLFSNNYKLKGLKDRVRMKVAYYVKIVNPLDGSETWDIARDINEELVVPPDEMFKSGDAKMKVYSQHERLRSLHHAREHEVIVKGKNQDVVLVFPNKYLEIAYALKNQNTMYRSMFTGEYTDADFWNKPLSQTLGVANNMLKAMYTSFNIVFPITNLARDIQEGTLTQWIKGESGVAVLKNYSKSFPAIIRQISGKSDPTNKYDQLLERFEDTGGPTGYTHLKTTDQLEKEFERDLADILNRKKIKGVMGRNLRHVVRSIEIWNQLFEDATRFSVFISAIESGKTDKEAASMAKEATVNFNRKGKITKTFDSLWAFFNVALESMSKNFGLARKYPKRFAIVAGGYMASGFLMTMLNDMLPGDDDDDYYNVSDYARRNYLVIPNIFRLITKGEKGDKYLRLPLSQFWRGFYAFGSLGYDVIVKKNVKPGKAIGIAGANFIGGLLPIDIGGVFTEEGISLSPIAPTVIKPIVEAVENRNFMGNKIYKEAFTQKQQKELSNVGMGKDNVNTAIKFFTDMMYLATGGEPETGMKYKYKNGEMKPGGLIDINPSVLEHLIKGYSGGTGGVVIDAITTAIQAFNPNEKVDFRNVPFVNAFIRKTPEAKWRVISEYYETKEEILPYSGLVSGYRKHALKSGDDTQYKKAYGDVYYREFQSITNQFDKLIELRSENVNYKTSEGTDEVVLVMKEYIKRIEELKKRYNK